MGLNLSWLVVDVSRRDALFERLGLEEVGEASNEFAGAYCCAELADGQLVLVVNDRSFALDEALAQVSSESFALGGEMSETVMCSAIRAFRNGRQLWSVSHDPEKDIGDVTVKGEPPPQLREIRGRLEAEQAADPSDDVDYMFDAPGDLAESLCGYRPGAGPACEWTVLQKKTAQKSARGGKPSRSLSAAIKSELFPLATSLGWQPAADHPFGFVRHSNRAHPDRDFTEDMWFDFESGERPNVAVGYAVWEGRIPDRRGVIQGHVTRPHVHVPFWKWLLGLVKPPPAPPKPEDSIGEAVAEGCRRLLILETFLSTGERRPEILGWVDPMPDGEETIWRPGRDSNPRSAL